MVILSLALGLARHFVYKRIDAGLGEARHELVDDLLHEQIVHAGAGQFGLLEGEPQVAQLGVARARITSLHLIQQGEDDRLEAAVGAAVAARSALAGVIIYICNTAAGVAPGVAVGVVAAAAAAVMTVVGFAVSPLQAALFLVTGRRSMVR